VSPDTRGALVGLAVLLVAARAADRSADLRTVFTWIGLLAAAGLAAYIVSDRAERRYPSRAPSPALVLRRPQTSARAASTRADALLDAAWDSIP
jgi:hypothetical protein